VEDRVLTWSRRAIAAAVVVYFFWALLLIAQKPGLQHDEALMVTASVQMLYTPHDLDPVHGSDSLIQVWGHSLPLMSMLYIGAVKEYLCLPLFRVLGTRASVVRLVSVLLAALGILGIALLIARHVSPPAGAALALVLAMNPSYTDLTVFDNSAIGPTMAALGLLCLAVSGYLRRQTPVAALWVGASIGFGVWVRANYLWMVAALAVAVLVVLRKRVFEPPVSHWVAGLAGGILGGAPFLIYQIRSRGGTWRAVGMLAAQEPWRARLYNRLAMSAEVLVSDREHRAIWAGPAMPGWQLWLFPAIVAAACLFVLFSDQWGRSTACPPAGQVVDLPHSTPGRDDRGVLWARIAALTLLLLSAIIISSGLPIAEHHLIVIVPVAAVVTVLAGLVAARRFRWGLAAAGVLGAIYLGVATYWQVSAIRGLGATGGVGMWSDGVNELAGYLERKYPGHAVKVLDWGLRNNVAVLTHGRVRLFEIYGDGFHEPWVEEIRKGGLFVLSAPDNRQFPAPAAAFLRALAACRPTTSRYSVLQRNHTGYAEVLDIVPNTARQVPADVAEAKGAGVSTGDAAAASLLKGFHQIEGTGWRWSARNFSITLTAPDPPGVLGDRLLVQLYIADSVIRNLGTTTLSARIHGHSLAPETYHQTGQYTFTREVSPDWLTPGPNVFEFSLDKAISPTSSEPRELGIVVMSASLEPQ